MLQLPGNVHATISRPRSPHCAANRNCKRPPDKDCMTWFHCHRWTVTGVTMIRRYNSRFPERTWPATEVLMVCDTCGDCQTKTLDGEWTLAQLQPAITTSDKDTLKRMGIRL